MAAAWNDVPATGGLSECAALVRSAEALRTSAPELSVQLARRALLVGATDVSASNAHGGEARSLSMRAQAVLTAGLVRTSQHMSAVEPGFAALGLAESSGALVLAAELRLDLAACAQEVGEPLLGGTLLRPVLEATSAPPSVRAAALGRLVGCIAHVARRDDIEDALGEADRLLAADDSLAPDARRVERARLAVRSAAYHRWYGDNEDAATAARDGLTLLSRLHRELRPESDRLHARLVLELVCALLDEGELHEAETAARPTVDEPVRATSAESVGQLMLALATRVHLPAGEIERGRGLVDQAAWLGERHGLDSVLADALTELSRLDEQAGRAKEALEAMRGARAAEQRRMRAVGRAARHLLLQVTASQGVRDATQQAVATLLRQLAHPSGVPVAMASSPTPRTALPARATPEPQQSEPITGELVGAADDVNLHEQRTGLLNREGLVSRLRTARTGERPVALTLVRFEPNHDNPEQDRGPDTGIMVGLADKVRGIAPENAELARSDGSELAVLLPATTRDQAEEFAATIRETATRSGWASDGNGKDLAISTSVVQSDPQAPDTDPHMDADTMLAAARDALAPAQTAGTTPASTEARTSTREPTADPSLAETKSALSALSQQPASAPEQSPTSPAEAPASALTDEPPTKPLTVTQPGEEPGTGRSILNSLSIPSGSGGRRRAGGEEPPGSKTARPSDSADAPRLTRAERRATEQAKTEADPVTGWPAEPDVSQALYRTARSRPRDEASSTAAAKATSYEETRAELARMMTTLNAKALKARTSKAEDKPDPTSATMPAAKDRPGSQSLPGPHQTLPTPPEPDDLPEPPSRPDIPEPPSRRPDVPTPPEPEPIPPAGPEPVPADPETFPPGSPDTFPPADQDSLAGGRRSLSSAVSETFPAGSPDSFPPADQESFSGGRRSLSSAVSETFPAGSPDSFPPADQDSLASGRRSFSSAAPETFLRGSPDSLPPADQDSSSAGKRSFSSAGLDSFSAERRTSPSADSEAFPPGSPDSRPPADQESFSGGRQSFSSAGLESFSAGGWTFSRAGSESSPSAESQPSSSAASESFSPAGLEPSSPDPRPSSSAGSESSSPGGRRSLSSAGPESFSSAEPKSFSSGASESFSSADSQPFSSAEPESFPPAGAESSPEAGESREPRSGLLAAFDALTGPVLSGSERRSGEDLPVFKTEFESGSGLPSRKPLTSWSAIESASAIDSPVGDLFGSPADGPKSESRLSLGAAFNLSNVPSVDRPRRGLPGASDETASAEPGAAETSGGPIEPPTSLAEPSSGPGASTQPPAESPAASSPASRATEDRLSTTAELRAALWDRLTTLAPTETNETAETAETPPTPETATKPAPTPAPAVGTEVSATVGEWSASTPLPPAASEERTTTPRVEPSANGSRPSGGVVEPSGDGRRPSGASVEPSTPPTYAEPIGPQPRPKGLPRRGERSATTIASLLTEALAAYQSTADDQQEPDPAPERVDSFAGDPAASAGRHRSPE